MGVVQQENHAVSASTVYLVRSVGSVWGVAITSAIIQTTLEAKARRSVVESCPESRRGRVWKHSSTCTLTT
ncbi:hypothetical protein AC579_8189 [Pseudocercospora musae]|uniref:Uncharacterized protein n=1 Tax=Pseudocercospora musae TaxID=113226 RepID=A0A139IV10_9PEZI|nr:hypothetical protein AC579_8189 [Pseudocercospora musae]